MSLAIVYSRALLGIDSPLVTVEVHLSRGMAGLNIVGLPAKAVKESKERVRSAILNSQFEFPVRRITINLAPADLPKEGGRFDLPIALGILAASGQISKEKLSSHEFCGELALTGEVRSVRGILPAILAAHRSQKKLIIPKANAAEATLAPKAIVFHANHLLAVCDYLKNGELLPRCQSSLSSQSHDYSDLSEVKGQIEAKRALEIAAAGKHSLLFIGPPGSGKTMLANRLPSILPNLSENEALAIAALESLSTNGFQVKNFNQIRFRSPHHSSSHVALVGGGRPPKPGEISLAHCGVLFLDELSEFTRLAIESLREPLEAGKITISRAAYQSQYPAQFQLICAMNPCPCGFANAKDEMCQCSAEQIKRYLAKLSGPFLDRIDMQVEVSKVESNFIWNKQLKTEKSETIRQRVLSAREIQIKRQGKANALLNNTEIEKHWILEASAEELLKKIMNQFKFSARVFYRLIKLAQTIADLEKSNKINKLHVSEALRYRMLDRTLLKKSAF